MQRAGDEVCEGAEVAQRAVRAPEREPPAALVEFAALHRISPAARGGPQQCAVRVRGRRRGGAQGASAVCVGAGAHASDAAAVLRGPGVPQRGGAVDGRGAEDVVAARVLRDVGDSADVRAEGALWLRCARGCLQMAAYVILDLKF